MRRTFLLLLGTTLFSACTEPASSTIAAANSLGSVSAASEAKGASENAKTTAENKDLAG